jgi:hypothetical protein
VRFNPRLLKYSEAVKRSNETTSIMVPKAITAGILAGNLNIPHMYTDNVGSEPVKKKAIINSSSEITKLINRDDIIPGITKGKVISLNVDHLVSPKIN